MSALRIEAAVRRFGSRGSERVALHATSLRAGPGEVIALVGPNGAGKTTLLKLIAGQLMLSAGAVTIDGCRAGTRAARRLVGLAPEPPVVPPFLSGRQWLRYLAAHRAQPVGVSGALVSWALDLVELGDVADRRVHGYSRGMRQRLALAGAAILGQRVVLLDETLSGIDPLLLRRLRGRLTSIAEAGRIVLVASHDLAGIERLATRVLVLVGGRIRGDEPTARLARERVAELTLTGGALGGVGRILARYRGAVRTGDGVAVPLTGGISVEQVLATCRQDRIAVTASRVRYRALEDLLVDAVAGEQVA